MEKIIPIFLMGMLVLSGLGAASFTTHVSLPQTPNIKNESTSVLFSSPTVSEKDGFVEIQVIGATTQLLEPERPVLPIYVKAYEIPFGSSNIQIVCRAKDTGTLTLTKEVIPARIAPLSKLNERTAYVKDPSVYESAAFYPSTWYSYDLGAGRNENNQEVIFVKVVCYPVRYSPLNNQIEYAADFDISLTYTPPNTPSRASTTSYDMVIIAPSKFKSSLQPLIDFKNGKGVATMFKSMEDILSEYTGYDQPEQVKYFIKDAYDNWNITYVLLVGGLKNHIYANDKDTRSAGWKAWWVPVRYVNMPNEDDEGCLSDLYYGCLYNATGVFDSWDSNGDGVYAAWNAPGAPKDKFDLYPEVYVSRLPVTNAVEVNIIVKKIITYESSGPDEKPWYKNFIGIAGKSFYNWSGQPDGEYLCDVAYNYTKLAIPDLHQIQIYSTNRDTGGLIPDTKDISSTIRQGAGFVDFEGHGYALGWNTIWFNGTYPNDWVGGIGLNNFWRIQNGKKLPVVIVGGCHNGLYNISILPAMKDKDGTRYFCHGLPGPVCFSWGLVIKPFGGAIASTGCTGYGVGSQSGDPRTILSAELESNFFYEIGHGSTHLAQTHSQAIQKYINENVIAQTDAYCITDWALFGDPSLMLGGYSS
jgi:Peptidase family C25/Propeptide_C25